MVISTHLLFYCAYYLYLINFHSKSLPHDHEILKMLMESLVFSQLNYALPIWQPAVHQNPLSRINRLYNRAVHIVCGLHKLDHVYRHCQAIGWLSVFLLTPHRTLYAVRSICVKVFYLILPFKFGRHHTHNTRCPVLSTLTMSESLYMVKLTATATIHC